MKNHLNVARIHTHMANIIPMAGLGSRFSNEGYTLPKPLIPVSGVPMVIKAIRDMPPSDKWIFMVRQEHITEYNLDKIIKMELPEAIIIPVKETTEGQASTCMLAEKYLDPNEPVFIAACDNGYLYDKEKYAQLTKNPAVDAIVWTFTQSDSLVTNPSAWGWIILDEDGETINDMSIKIPVSNDPYNDHAVVATFFFRRAKDFIDATILMIEQNYRINSEFYVDALPIFLKKLGKRSVFFDVDLYVGWGTPKDYLDYQGMEKIIQSQTQPPSLSAEDTASLPLWRKYLND